MSAPVLLTMRGFVAAARADGTIIGPENPARPGDRIRLFGRGLEPEAGVSVAVGDLAAVVTGTSLLGAGLYQIDIVVPALAPGDYRVLAKCGAHPTPPGALLRVGARRPPP